MNVLIADDQIGIVMSLSLLVEEKGHIVATAMDGRSALNMLKGNTYDLAFLDNNMPELTGLEIVQYIKRNNIRTKTVMITSDKTIERAKAIASGAYEYIEKPYDVNQIIAILNNFPQVRH